MERADIGFDAPETDNCGCVVDAPVHSRCVCVCVTGLGGRSNGVEEEREGAEEKRKADDRSTSAVACS